MDIDFIIQDTFALTRPQWKLNTDFEEAGRLFAEQVKQNYKTQEVEKPIEAEEPDDGGSSDDEADDEELAVPDMDAQSSSDEAEAEVSNAKTIVDIRDLLIERAATLEWRTEARL